MPRLEGVRSSLFWPNFLLLYNYFFSAEEHECRTEMKYYYYDSERPDHDGHN